MFGLFKRPKQPVRPNESLHLLEYADGYVILGEGDRIVAEFNDRRKAIEFYNKHMAHTIWTEGYMQ